MPESDPFDGMERLFEGQANEPLIPGGYVPTRKEAVVRPPALRTPTRAEAVPTRREKAGPAPTSDNATAYRPRLRPPMAILCICDDGSDEGEVVRIRQARFVIGRTQGDLNIPLDERIAPRHAEIVRDMKNGKHVWHLNDLQSATGTFVSVPERAIVHGTEILLGSRYYVFEIGIAGGAAVLREVTGAGRHVLDPPIASVGRTPGTNDICIADDPCLGGQHARFDFTPESGWKVVNLGSRNGVWVRTDRVRFAATCRFQLGEQRFHVRVPT